VTFNALTILPLVAIEVRIGAMECTRNVRKCDIVMAHQARPK
jgi:hypothetical protein